MVVPTRKAQEWLGWWVMGFMGSPKTPGEQTGFMMIDLSFFHAPSSCLVRSLFKDVVPGYIRPSARTRCRHKPKLFRDAKWPLGQLMTTISIDLIYIAFKSRNTLII